VVRLDATVGPYWLGGYVHRRAIPSSRDYSTCASRHVTRRTRHTVDTRLLTQMSTPLVVVVQSSAPMSISIGLQRVRPKCLPSLQPQPSWRSKRLRFEHVGNENFGAKAATVYNKPLEVSRTCTQNDKKRNETEIETVLFSFALFLVLALRKRKRSTKRIHYTIILLLRVKG